MDDIEEQSVLALRSVFERFRKLAEIEEKINVLIEDVKKIKTDLEILRSIEPEHVQCALS